MSSNEGEHKESHKAHGHGGGHGGGAHEEHEGAPEWLISFADNVMLQMGFFVILLALNMGIKAKAPSDGDGNGAGGGGGAKTEFLDFAIAVRAAFNNPVDLDSKNPSDEMLVRRILQKREGSSRQPGDAGSAQESQAMRPTEYSALGGVVPFDDEADTLSPGGRTRAEEVAARLRGLRWTIEVRGHASPSETFRDVEKGIALGHARALAVAKVLVEQGVRWDQLRVVSCGDHEQNLRREYDRTADRQNQRVEIIVTGDPAPGEPAAPGSSVDAGKGR